MKKKLLIPLLFFIHSALFAQAPIIDSLKKQLATDLPDSVRVLSLMRLAVNYEGIDTMESAKAYRAAIAFAKSKKMGYQLGVIFQNYHFLFINRGFYGEAEKYLDSAFVLIEAVNTPKAKESLAMIYGSYGAVERYKGNYQKAIESFLTSVSIFESLNKPERIITPLLNVSGLYKEMNEYEKQEMYAAIALTAAKKSGNIEKLFMPYSYLVYGLIMQNKFEQAKPYFDSAKFYYTQNVPYEALVSFNLVGGLLYMNLNKLDSAEYFFRQSLLIAQKYSSVFSITQSKLQLGRVLTMKKEFAAAEKILLEALEEIKKTKEPGQFLIAYDYLSRFYEESGNSNLSLKYHKLFKEVSDSISSDKNKRFATELEMKFETEKKETQLKLQELELKRKNTLNYFLSAGIAALMLISILGYRNYRHKQKLQLQRITELETQQQLAATEAVLKGEEQERTRLAKDLHDGLGGMLSGIKYSMNTMKGNLILTPDNAQAFERSMDMLDSSIKEMRRVAHNLMPEALVKFGLDTALKDFCNDIHQSGALNVTYQSVGLQGKEPDQTTTITIFRIVQELLNNTLKHAAAKNAVVQINRTDEQLSVTVEDDGRGFNTALLQHSGGIGWSNIQNRVEFMKGTLDVQSAEGKGTSVHIEMNI